MFPQGGVPIGTLFGEGSFIPMVSQTYGLLTIG